MLVSEDSPKRKRKSNDIPSNFKKKLNLLKIIKFV